MAIAEPGGGFQDKAARVIDKVVIATSTTKSGGVRIGGAVRGMILAPITGTINFEGSADGTNWYPIYNGATQDSIAATVNRLYPIPATTLANKYIRCDVPAQGADLPITFILKAV